MGRLDAAVAAQPPGAFAFVMATGIVSVGLGQQAVAGPSIALLGVAVVGYVVLLAGLGARLTRHRALVVADLPP